MSPKIKIILYAVILLAAAYFGYQFLNYYRKVMEEETTAVETKPSKKVAETATNQPGTDTNTTPAPPSNVTNAVDAASTNNPLKEVSKTTNAPSAAVTDTNAAGAAQDDPYALEKKKKKPTGAMLANGGAFIGMMILLAILISSDVSRFFANKTEEFLFNDDGKGSANPEYEEAERVWANGDHLDAIRLMRDYLKKYPRDQFVAIRIAEIYEKDLQNYLAAALEYEEILQKKLPAERWGWAAIHLSNLYSGKLDRMDEAVALLRRIDAEYGHTAAANKARQRLAKIDGTPEAGTEEPT